MSSLEAEWHRYSTGVTDSTFQELKTLTARLKSKGFDVGGGEGDIGESFDLKVWVAAYHGDIRDFGGNIQESSEAPYNRTRTSNTAPLFCFVVLLIHAEP